MIHGSASGRTTAALTGSGSTDYTSDLDMRYTLDGKVTVEIAFTIGSLTNCVWAALAGNAATPTTPLVTGGLTQTGTWTSSTTVEMTFDVPGCRYFRMSLTGTGTPTSSDAVVTYRYNDYRTTTHVDGNERID